MKIDNLWILNLKEDYIQEMPVKFYKRELPTQNLQRQQLVNLFLKLELLKIFYPIIVLIFCLKIIDILRLKVIIYFKN